MGKNETDFGPEPLSELDSLRRDLEDVRMSVFEEFVRCNHCGRLYNDVCVCYHCGKEQADGL